MLFRGQTLGKYKIVAPLGSGGFGAVYLARDTWIDKDVAIKVPHRQNINFSELLREPRLLATLDHPNIISVTTAEKQENVFFIVMEYVPGDTLENLIANDGPLAIPRALDFAIQICHAVQHAHDQGVIHRDLRPPNMLVSETDMLKVADFGTSRFLEMAAQGTTVIGSPPYMAPEQFEGKAVFASDIYSLGVTMYQMLCGSLPYEAPAPSDLNRLMRGDLVRPLRIRNTAIPTSLSDIVMRAMAPDLPSRYQSAGDLLVDLQASRKRRERRAVTSQVGISSTHPSGHLTVSRTDVRGQSRATDTATAPFCWQCHKPLHARADQCPFCGEIQ